MARGEQHRYAAVLSRFSRSAARPDGQGSSTVAVRPLTVGIAVTALLSGLLIVYPLLGLRWTLGLAAAAGVAALVASRAGRAT